MLKFVGGEAGGTKMQILGDIQGEDLFFIFWKSIFSELYRGTVFIIATIIMAENDILHLFEERVHRSPLHKPLLLGIVQQYFYVASNHR